MTTGFLGAVIFSLVFFGVYSLHQVAFTTGQARTIHLLIAITFVVLGWLLSRF
jgi:hypothetical protein